MFRTPLFWYVVLLAACIIAPYVFRVPPRQRSDWRLLTATVAFLTWLLLGFAFVRSR